MSSSEGSDRGSPLMRRSSEYEITENEETESNVNNRSPNNERSETEPTCQGAMAIEPLISLEYGINTAGASELTTEPSVTEPTHTGGKKKSGRGFFKKFRKSKQSDYSSKNGKKRKEGKLTEDTGSDDKVRQLEDEIKNNRGYIDALEDINKKLHDENTDLSGEYNDLSIQIIVLEESNEIQERNRIKSENEIRRRQDQNAGMKKEIEQLKQRNTEKVNEIERYRQRDNNKDKEIERLQREKTSRDKETEHLAEEITLRRNRMKQLEDKNERLEQENTTIYGDNQRLQQENATITGDNQRLQQENATITGENQRLEQENATITDENQRLEQENATITDDNQRLEQENATITGDNQRLEQENATITGDNQRLRQENQRLQQENTTITGDNQRIEQENATITGENQRLEQENATITGENQRLEQENATITGHNQRLRQENQRLREEEIGSGDALSLLVSHEELGRGAYGVVYKGDFYGTEVAVKQFHEIILSPYNRRMLQREIKIASKCRHPNLLQFICATTNDRGQLLIVTELMDVSLRRLVEQYAIAKERGITQLDYHDTIKLISLDVARGLNYIHSKHDPIIHRDISSANVLLSIDENGVVRKAKISDYGSANFIRACNTANPGAAAYAAPEAREAQQDPNIDVFSYGLLVCEMSTCEHPDPIRRDEQIRKISDIEVKGLVRNCTDLEKQKRPTMQEVIEFWQNMN